MSFQTLIKPLIIADQVPCYIKSKLIYKHVSLLVILNGCLCSIESIKKEVGFAVGDSSVVIGLCGII